MANEKPKPLMLSEKIASVQKAARESISGTRASDPIHQAVGAGIKTIQEVAEAWRQQVQEIISACGLFITQTQQIAAGIAAVMEEASNQFNEVLKRSDHVAKLGWTFHPDLPVPYAFRLSKATTQAEADAYVLGWYEVNDPQLQRMECRLREHRLLVKFDTVLEQCFDAIRREDYAITISNLMYMLEAVVTAFNPPHLQASTDVNKILKKGGKLAKQAEKDLLTAAVWLSLMTFVHDLYKQRPFVGTQAVPDLSRQATQHGRAAPPNEKIEVLRLLHALETALGLHREIGVSIQPASRGSA